MMLMLKPELINKKDQPTKFDSYETNCSKTIFNGIPSIGNAKELLDAIGNKFKESDKSEIIIC